MVIFRTGRFVAAFQKYKSEIKSETLASLILKHAQLQLRPEIDGVVVVRSAGDISEIMPVYMQAYCNWHFANSPQ
jgi:hypothetical protein